MLTDPPTDILLARFLDALPDSAFYLQALRDEQQQLADLLLAYGNEKGIDMARAVFEMIPGERMLGDNPERWATLQPLFRRYDSLLLTGQPQQFNFPSPMLQRVVQVNCSRLADGVLVTVREPDEQPQLDPIVLDPAELLNGILEASLNGIITYQSMRDESGQITDFSFVRFNGAARRMLNLTDETVGKPMLDQIPGVKEADLFAKVVQVVETGEPMRFQTSFRMEDKLLWYEMSVVKLGDGFVLTFNDITESKQAALENERQRTLLDGILNASQDAVFVLEAIREPSPDGRLGAIVDFRYTHTNPMVTQVFGHSADRLLSSTLLTLYPGMKNNGLFDTYCTVADTGETYHAERYYDTDGIQNWYDITAVKLGDGVVLTLNDISLRKQTEQQIERQAEENKRQAEFLNNVLDSSSNGIVTEQAVRDAEGRIVDFLIVSANRQAAETVQSTVDELVGKRDLELHPNLHESGLFAAYVRTVETGEPQFVETYYNDGRLDHWINVNTRKLGDGQVVTFINVSETKRLQQALEQSIARTKQQAELMQSMLDGAINGVLLLEPVRDETGEVADFRIRGGNPAAYALTGVEVRRALGQLMSEVYPGYKEAGFFAVYRRAIETGEPQRTENYYKDDALQAWFDVSATPQRFAEGANGIVLTFTNATDTRRAQEAIERGRAELQAVIDNSQTGIFVFSPVYDEAGRHVDFRFKTINRMVAQLVKQTPEALTGAVASDWFTSYRETGLFDRYRHTFETGEDQRFDIHYNVDGFNVWFDVHSVKFGADVLVTFTNYTDLKLAQLAVEHQAELLNSVLDSSNSGIIAFEAIRNEHGRIIDFYFVTVNEACERILNLPLETMRGNKLLTLFPGNVDAGTFDLYVQTTETGKPGRTETYYNYDGLDFWLDISAQKLGDGFVVTFTDISEVKRTQRTVERAAAELQTVIDTSQTGIFLFSPVRDPAGTLVDFRFRVANRQLASYVGKTPEMVVGGLCSTHFPSYKTNGLFEAYRKTYLTGEPQRFDFHYDGDGIDVWLDILSTKTGDEVLVTFGDYTPLKRLQQQLENSIVDLQRSNRNLEQFAYVASHDLQEPLRKIQAFGDIIETQYGQVIGEQGTDIIKRMQSAAARMQVLIKDVLAYSRIATRREVVQPVELNGLMHEVLTDLETAIDAKQAVVRVSTLPTVPGDASQLRQLFQNLISNALKFTKPKPTASGNETPRIEVTTRLVRGRDADAEPAGVPVPATDADRLFHLIQIADNGIGFEPHHGERIFQVFQRLHGRSQYEGTGIGLAIVQKVVENHQGYIKAHGRPGEGATFIILLPAQTG